MAIFRISTPIFEVSIRILQIPASVHAVSTRQKWSVGPDMALLAEKRKMLSKRGRQNVFSRRYFLISTANIEVHIPFD